VKNVGVVIFPGTNCDQETIRMYQSSDRFVVREIWYNDPLPTGFDLIFLPGGWSYGDTLRAGAIARFSKVMNGIIDHAKSGGLVIGVCNGFQILTEAGLLPGAIARNSSLRFRCEVVNCRVEPCNTPFFKGIKPGTVIPIPIAHGEGRYVADEKTLERMEAHGLVALRYCDTRNITSEKSNPNGSMRNIAGIVNREGNVLGMMPHPERRANPLVGGAEGLPLLTAWADA